LFNYIISIILERRITQNNTLFNYRSTLKIDNVQKSDAGNYTCVGKYIVSNKIPFFETTNYKLIVHGNYDVFIYLTKSIF